jgi:RHS repeat-associated protein
MEGNSLFKQTYNSENRIASVQKLRSGACTDANPLLETKWDFAYDGDGVRTATLITPYDVSGAPQTATLTSYYFGGAYEVTGTAVKKYYSFGGQTMMRDANGLQYFITDHLGSVVAVTSDRININTPGTLIAEQRYLPFGAERTNVGGGGISLNQTDLGYTGQRDDSYIKLMDYDFRWYDPELGRFISPDSIVPNPANPQSLNRYSYVINNPLRYSDPTGHKNCEEDGYNCPGNKTPALILKQSGGNVTDDIKNQINQYMQDNPSYDSAKDPFWKYGPKNDSVSIVSLIDIRREYWTDRAERAGCKNYTECSSIGEANFSYYDMGIKPAYYRPWDGSKVNWGDVGLDLTSIGLGLFGLNEVPQYAKMVKGAQTMNAGISIFNISRIGSDYFAGKDIDSTGSALTVGGLAPGPYGVAASIGSLVHNINKGYGEIRPYGILPFDEPIGR